MNALLTAAPFLGPIGLGVAAVGLFGRDPQADEHDVADYRPVLAPARRNWPLVNRQVAERRPVPSVPAAALVVAPAPNRSVFAEAAAVVGIWPADAGAIVAVVASSHGDSPADRAARMLREIAAEQRELAVAR